MPSARRRRASPVWVSSPRRPRTAAAAPGSKPTCPRSFCARTVRSSSPVRARSGILARTGHIPLRYYNDPVKTDKTFKTYNGIRYSIPGDQARVEDDGTVTMLGRGSVSINSGGEKIHPEEVESALKAHPDVFDTVVVGVPDERYGQRVAAIVATRDGLRPTLDEINAVARQDIAGYKCPRIGLVRRRDQAVTCRQTQLSLGCRDRRIPARRRDPRNCLTKGLTTCVPHCPKSSESNTRSSASRRPNTSPRRSAGPAVSECWAASASTRPTSSTPRWTGCARTPTANRSASTS